MLANEIPDSVRLLGTESDRQFHARGRKIRLPGKKGTPNLNSRPSSGSSTHSPIESNLNDKSRERRQDTSRNGTRDKSEVCECQFTVQAEGNLKCSCSICKAQNEQKKIELKEIIQDPFFEGFDFENERNITNYERDFVFVLKRLMPPKYAAQSLSLNIPETIVYINGEARFIVQTGRDKTLKFTVQREKLAQHEIKKFFKDNFAKRDEEFKQFENSYLNSTTMIAEETESSIERGPGLSVRKESLESSAHPFAMGKSLERRRARALKARDFSIAKEVALVKFHDDSTSPLFEIEFENLMSRKKFDPYWKKIAYIQNYKGLTKNIQTLQRVYFVYDREKQNPLFQRASVEVHQVNGEIPPSSDHYIPPYEEEEFELTLKYENETQYCLYILMKVYHFLEIVHGLRILKMGGDFVKDIFGVTWLTNISRLQYQSLPDKVKTDGHVRGMSLLGMKFSSKSPVPTTVQDPARQEDVEAMTDKLVNEYRGVKEAMGIKNTRPEYQEDISDNAFAQIYPKMPFKLSSMLKTHIRHRDFTKGTETKKFKKTVSQYLPVSEKKGDRSDHENLGIIKKVFPQLFPATGDSLRQNTSRSGMNTARSQFREERSSSGMFYMNKRSLSPLNTDDNENLSTILPRKSRGLLDKSRSRSQPNFRKTLQRAFEDISAKLQPHPQPHAPPVEHTTKDTLSDAYVRISRRSRRQTEKCSLGERSDSRIDFSKSGIQVEEPYVKELKNMIREPQAKQPIEIGFNVAGRKISRKSLGYILSNGPEIN